ncbi:hypothetical protein [Streptomyces canus]|uniref:hypothetical protein n=1 Tax=Streptomyces canus TaxID=58343 RepID=UPI00339F9CE5
MAVEDRAVLAPGLLGRTKDFLAAFLVSDVQVDGLEFRADAVLSERVPQGQRRVDANVRRRSHFFGDRCPQVRQEQFDQLVRRGLLQQGGLHTEVALEGQRPHRP